MFVSRCSYLLALAMLLVMLIPADAAAQNRSDEERGDRATFNRLNQQLRQVDRDYARAVDRAMEEAKQSEDGEASLETKSNLIALRNQRDRLLNRMTLLSLRWGWEMPDHDSEVRAREVDPRSEWEQLFDPADRVIRDRFAKESRDIARRVVMPLISIPAGEGGSS